MDRRVRPLHGWLAVTALLLPCLPPSARGSHPGLCGTAADDLVAARAGLHREWVVQVPFDSQRWRLDRVAVGRDVVVAQAGDRSLTAFATGATDAPPGALLWTIPGDGSRYPIESLSVGFDDVEIARGGRLVAVDALTGKTVADGPLPRATAADRVVVEYLEDDCVKRLHFDLGSPMSGPAVVRGTDAFVATRAGDVARIARSPSGLRATTGVGRNAEGEEVAYTGWHTVIDAEPEGSPMVGGNAVVVSLGPSGMAAFDATTGDLLWRCPQAGTPLAILGGRVWCLDATGFLSARDLRTGCRVARLCVGGFTVPVIDPAGERLVLASPEGLVVSLVARRTVPAGSGRSHREPAGEQVDRQNDAADREGGER